MRKIGTMTNVRRLNSTLLCITAVALGSFSMGSGCPGGGVLGVLPFGQITAVQLFDEPAFTMAISATDAISNPGAVTKINWVFGDGGGFVEGLPGRTTITHQYASPGSYQVTAFVFGPTGFIDQVAGTINVLDSGGGGGGGGGGTVEKPAKATGFSPANDAVDVPVKNMLMWTAGTRATSHDVYLGTDMTAVTDATRDDATNFKGNQTTVKYDPGDAGLLENTTYYWRIDEINTGGTTKGDVISFKTARAPTKAKSPVPANTSVSARVTQLLSWTAGLRTSTHDVYFGKVMAEVDTATKDTPNIFKGNQTGLTFNPDDEDAAVVGELLAATQYFWRIDEVGPGGTVKGDVWTFTTQALPPAVTNPMPANNATSVTTTIHLSWDGVASIEGYDVYFGTSELDVMLAGRSSPEFKTNQTTKTFDPGSLLPNLDYFWRIDTIGPGGTAEGLVFKFTTAALPATVVAPFVPADQATGIDVETNLTWTAGMGGPVMSYDVYLGTDQAAVTNLSAGALQVNLPVGTTLFNPATNLIANTNYFWRIVSKGPGGSANGPVLTFRTGILALVAESPVPANNLVGAPLDQQLSWTAGQDAASHDVYFGTNQSSVQNATDMDAEFKGNQAGTMYDPGTLDANKDYFWRIDEVASGGKTKGPVWKFTTGPGKAIALNPLNASTGNSVDTTLQWNAGTGATSHNVYFGTDLMAVTNATVSTLGIFRGNQAGTNYDPPEALTGNTDYFWRIDSVSATATTKGDVWTFKTAVGKPTNPIPTNLATGQDLNVDLQWTAGAANVSFDVYFGTSLAAVTNATTSDPEFKGNQAGTSYDPGLLTANTDYFWRIDGKAADMTTTKGDVWQFKTLAPPPQATNPNPGNNATGVAFAGPTLSWSAALGATGYDVFLDTVTPPVMQISTNQAGTNIMPGALLANTTYFWRVSPRNGAGTTAGVVWTFTTAP